MPHQPNPSLALRLQVLSAIDHAPGNTIRERIKAVAERPFIDHYTGHTYRFTWRTISTWLYRYKKDGITTLEPKTRSDKHSHRKVSLNELAEALHEVLPGLSKNKQGSLPKSVLYRTLLSKGYFTRRQLAPTTFYRMLREQPILEETVNRKLRLSFAMQYANQLWQADTMHGPTIKQANGQWKKTFLIAFIDDASRVITHAQFFYRDNTQALIGAFRTALFKRGKPERLYFDNGANYSAKEMLQACLRLDIQLSHAPVRDGAAKGKIERFFRGFRDRFLTTHLAFDSLAALNTHTQQWVENDYNSQHHSGIGMIPIDRFNLDQSRIHFLTDDEFSEEVFFMEQDRKVSKTNVFSICAQRWECPVDLRGKTIQVRYDRQQCNRFIVFFNGHRLGDATRLDLQHNARILREHTGGTA